MKHGNHSYTFENVYLNNTGTAVGPREGLGPLAKSFDKIYDSLRMDEDSFEQAEIKLQRTALDVLFSKTLELERNIDIAFAGDLVNQDVISNYTLRNYDIPFCGVYGACSTSVLSMLMGSLTIDGNNAKKVISMTSSHNATSERQFRNPTEYGGAKNITSTFTVSGACAALLSTKKSKIKITKGTIGKVIDVEFKDSTDMGRAMAPAACETLLQHFDDFKAKPSDYDLIVTGDLSTFGKEIVQNVLDIEFGTVTNYNDCGLMIYDLDNQQVFAGGSGCACCGVVSYGYIFKEMLEGRLKKVLICATGALMNTNMSLQKESIPAVAHAIVWEVV